MSQTVKVDVKDWAYESVRQFIKWLIALGFSVSCDDKTIEAIRTE